MKILYSDNSENMDMSALITTFETALVSDNRFHMCFDPIQMDGFQIQRLSIRRAGSIYTVHITLSTKHAFFKKCFLSFRGNSVQEVMTKCETALNNLKACFKCGSTSSEHFMHDGLHDGACYCQECFGRILKRCF